MERLREMRTGRSLVGAILCFTPVFPLGVAILMWEYVRAGRQMGAEAADPTAAPSPERGRLGRLTLAIKSRTGRSAR